MRMGNFLTVHGLLWSVMSAKRSSFGMRHVTVVPTNFTPPESDDEDASDDAPTRDGDTRTDDVDSRDA